MKTIYWACTRTVIAFAHLAAFMLLVAGHQPAMAQTPPETWTYCAAEHGSCTPQGTRAVRIGATATSQYAEKIVTGSIDCTFQNFTASDPAPNQAKSCWYGSVDRSVSPVTWTQCAVQYATCSFTGTRLVRHGVSATSQYIEKVATGSQICTFGYFGPDPAPGLDKSCWYSSVTVSPGGIPAPTAFNNLPTVGPITAFSGQVITGVHITSTNSACITIPANVSGVTIIGNNIGPCGSPQTNNENTNGINMVYKATNIVIRGNVCHDVASCIYADTSEGVVVDRNQVFNIRGPLPRGQMVQFVHFKAPVTYPSKITCNRVDGLYQSTPAAALPWIDEDHINLGDDFGSAALPIEIAYNRIRGTGNYKVTANPNVYDPTSSESGTGMMIGDTSATGTQATAGYVWVHDNTIVKTNGAGISLYSGDHITIENNRVKNDGPNVASMTGWAFGSRACTNSTIRNNQGIARLWAYDRTGMVTDGYIANSAYPCTGLTTSGNSWQVTPPPAPLTDAIFDQAYSACN